MPEPLKNQFNKSFVLALSRQVQSAYPGFDSLAFGEGIFTSDWETKELKQRINTIAASLNVCLPGDYKQCIDILKSASESFSGLQHMVFPAYVELYGLTDFETSMSALAYFTENSSSEFAIRPFIVKFPERAMQQMRKWAESSNHHVRRLSSEGCRPRLPWAMSLPQFKRDPQPVLRILERLKDDESLYVRRSAANNLNDISKDHPAILIRIAEDWLGKSQRTDWLIKHACRSLLKQGEPGLLRLFGFGEPGHVRLEAFDLQNEVNVGERLTFSFSLVTGQRSLGKLRIEYAIDFQKSNGQQTRKIFKVSESENAGSVKHIVRNHSFRPISTRTYYQGAHGLAVIVNGREMTSGSFQLNIVM